MSKGNRIKQESMAGSSLEYRDLENDENTDFYEDSDYSDYSDSSEDSDLYDNEFHLEDDYYENDDEEEFFDDAESPRFQENAGQSLLDDIWDNQAEPPGRNFL